MCPVLFNRSRIGEMAASEQIVEDIQALVCVKAERHFNDKNDNIKVRTSWRVLKDPDDPTSYIGPVVNDFWTLPCDNADIEGHVAPRHTGSMTCEYLSRLYPDEVFAPPRWNKTTGRLEYQREEIDPGQEAIYRAEAIESGFAKAEELYGQDGEGLAAMVGILVYSPIKNDPQFGPKMIDIRCDLPPSWQLAEEQVKLINVPVGTEDEAETKAPPVRQRKSRRSRQ